MTGRQPNAVGIVLPPAGQVARTAAKKVIAEMGVEEVEALVSEHLSERV
jgi:hypothetical protein